MVTLKGMGLLSLDMMSPFLLLMPGMTVMGMAVRTERSAGGGGGGGWGGFP